VALLLYKKFEGFRTKEYVTSKKSVKNGISNKEIPETIEVTLSLALS